MREHISQRFAEENSIFNTLRVKLSTIMHHCDEQVIDSEKPELLTEISPEYSRTNTRDRTPDTISSEEITLFSNPRFLSDLKYYFSLFGLSNSESAIYASCIHYYNEDITKSILSQSMQYLSPKEFDEALSGLKNRGLLETYQKLNSKKRLVTYYHLSKSPEEMIRYFTSYVTDHLLKMHDCFEKIDEACKESDLSGRKSEVIQNLIFLGVDPKISNLLVALHQGPLSDEEIVLEDYPELHSSSLLNTIRRAITAGIVCSQDVKHNTNPFIRQYSLTLPLSEIAANILLRHEEELDMAFSDVKKYILFKETKEYTEAGTPATPESRNIDYYLNSGYGKKRNTYNLPFLEAVKDVVTSHSDPGIIPFEMELVSPYPARIRAYLFKIRSMERTDFTVYNALIQIPALSTGSTAEFNFEEGAFVLLGGYYPEKDLFVFWDAMCHSVITSYQHVLSIKGRELLKAEKQGICSYDHTLLNGQEEHVTVARSEHLKEALRYHYLHHLNTHGSSSNDTALEQRENRILKDLEQIIRDASLKYSLDFTWQDVELTSEFKAAYSAYVSKNKASVEFYDSTAVITTPPPYSKYIFVPNQWFIIASYPREVYTELMKYKSYFRKITEYLGVKPDEYAKNLKAGTGPDEQERFLSAAREILESEHPDEEEIALETARARLWRFVSDYPWWSGQKTIDRGDFHVSVILNMLNLVNASQSYVADIVSAYGNDMTLNELVNEQERFTVNLRGVQYIPGPAIQGMCTEKPVPYTKPVAPDEKPAVTGEKSDKDGPENTSKVSADSESSAGSSDNQGPVRRVLKISTGKVKEIKYRW